MSRLSRSSPLTVWLPMKIAPYVMGSTPAILPSVVERSQQKPKFATGY
jgi:hypothetical protein